MFTCLIIDDEPLALELLKNHISKIPNLDLIDAFTTATDAFSCLTSQDIDILFLDIEMPNITGIDFLKSLDKPPLTIFTTAYSEFALESYNLNAIDYILKPITFERFFKATQKAISKLSSFNKNVQDYLFVKSEGKAIKVNYDDILFIESQQKYVNFYTKNDIINCLMSLSKLESILPQDKFMRIHKSFIVQLNKINTIEGNRIKVDSYTISVSKTIKPDLLSRVDKFNLL